MNLQAFTRRAAPPIMAAAALGAGLTACGQASSPQPPAIRARHADGGGGRVHGADVKRTELQFVADVRNVLSFGSNVTDASVASFGQRACRPPVGNDPGGRGAARPAGLPGPLQGRRDPADHNGGKDLCPAESGPQQVTYVATGSSADVTYGPSGSGYQGAVPLTVTKPLVGNPQFYSMSAQLKAGGSVTCAIKVDGVTIVSASASGSTNVASCAMGQDLNGSWEQTSLNG